MFELAYPWWQLLARAAVVYLLVLVLLRLFGKRQVGQLTPFDLALLLLISEGASNALRADENSVTGAAIVIAALLAMNWGVGRLGVGHRTLDRLTEGRPRFLLKDGRVDYATLRRESITYNELLSALRSAGCFTPHQARYAVLETNGRISVGRKEG